MARNADSMEKRRAHKITVGLHDEGWNPCRVNTP